MEIDKHLKGCKTVLDVGCGNNSPLRFLNKKYRIVGVDNYQKALDESRQKAIHDKYYKLDIKKLSNKFKKNSFDAVVALDVIEHLKKNEGYKLLKDMENAARKKVILVTPNGFVPQYNKDNNLQEHLSGWKVCDFTNRGYYVEGIYGTKFCNVFRTEEAELRWKPRFFWRLIWGILVEITHHLYTKNNPQYSIGLLAVKKIA
jgi:SAM-dependent methyltransferase